MKNTNAILRFVILAGLFLLPFVALVVVNHLFFPFITGKNFIFRIIVEIIFACWVVLALRDGNYLPKSSWLVKCFGIFLAVMFIADLLSPNPFKSFWSNYERMEGFVTLIHLFALLIVASSVLTKKLWERLFQTSVAVSVALFIYSVLQLAGKLEVHQGGVRVDATLGNATYLAVYMLFHVFITILLIVWWRGGSWMRWIYGLIILSELFTLYHTAARGAILGLFGGLFIGAILVAIFENKNKVFRSSAIAVVVLVSLIVGGFLLVKNQPFVSNNPVLGRFSGISLNDKTTESRFMIWNMAWQGFKERPIFGWGQESFNYVFNKYYDPRMYSQEQWFDRTHDIVFDWLTAGGLLGLLSYLSLFGAALCCLWRKSSTFTLVERSIFTGLLAGYFFHNIFVFDNITSYILFIFILGYLNSGSCAVSDNLKKKLKSLDLGIVNRIVAPAVLVALIIVIYFVNVPALMASSALISALSGQPGGPAVNLQYFEKALSYHSLGDSEIREQLAQTVSQMPSSGVDPSLKASFFELTRKELLKQLERTPNDARYQIFTGSFLDSFGRYDEALVYLKKASELSPKKQTILFELGSAYINKRDFTDALAVMKRTFELEPSSDASRRIYALTAVYAGNAKLAESVLAPIDPNSVLADKRFMAAYVSSGQYGKALESLNYLSNSDPNNIQYYLNEAGVYLQLNRRDLAIERINKAVKANPSFKDQGESFIKAIREGKNP